MRLKFEEKVKDRLLDMVYNWKCAYETHGYEKGKPSFLTFTVWDGIIAFWNHPDSIKTSNTNSANRLTPDEHGNTKMLHTTGRTPHAGIRLKMVNILINTLKKLYTYMYF